MSLIQKNEHEAPRSYVLRNGRITTAQKRALKNLKDLHVLPLRNKKLDFLGAFTTPNKKLIADVGFGSGESLLYMAENYEDANLVGIDLYAPGIGATLNQIEKKGLTNLKIIESDVRNFLKDYVENETFDVMVFLYPDPWPKRKHHKRRLLSKGFFNLLYKKLVPEGLVYCKTDWEDYYFQIEEEFSLSKGWQKEDLNSLPVALKSLPKTNYEKKALTGGRNPRELFYRKVSTQLA